MFPDSDLIPSRLLESQLLAGEIDLCLDMALPLLQRNTHAFLDVPFSACATYHVDVGMVYWSGESACAERQHPSNRVCGAGACRIAVLVDWLRAPISTGCI